MSECLELDEQDQLDEMVYVVIDYTGQYALGKALVAQGKGTNFLALFALDRPIEGAKFELVYRRLSQPCKSETDQAWCCVRGSEVSYWKITEMIEGKKLMRDIKNGKANIFEHFNLF